VNSRARRTSSLVALLASVVLGCSLQPPPERDEYGRALVKVRFDSNVTILAPPPRPLDDTALIRLTNVLEIGGPALVFRRDTLLLFPSYVVSADTEHPGKGRTIRRSGPQGLPEIVFIPLHTGVRIESFPKARVSSMLMPTLVGLTCVLYLAYVHR